MTKHTKIWRIPNPNTALQDIFALKLGLSKVVAQVLINRGITTVDEARDFLAASTHSLYDPMLMKDMDKGVQRILSAVEKDEKIRIFGDYDVDGITSTCIIMKVLKHLGASVDYYIPERLTEGYGINCEAITTALADGVSLVITVDCGISAVDEIAFACKSGLDIIVTDHHEPPEEIPKAFAVINPKQRVCTYPFKHLAGVGVAYKLGQALLKQQDTRLLEEMAELVCLGTIADIVPLQGENRVFVKSGLSHLERTGSVGMKALIEHCGLAGERLNTRQIGYQMVPKINAAGRLGDASIGVTLLLTHDPREASNLAAALCAMNEERQGIEAAIFKDALQIIEVEVDLKKEKIIVLAREGWHLGVIGIVASRLVQQFARPVVLLCIDGATAKGSARSIPSFNIFEAFQANDRYLDRFGGHKQAAGLTISVDKLSEFSAAINNYADEKLQSEDMLPEVLIDCEIKFTEVDNQLYKQLDMLAPYGCDNPCPVLACRGTSIPEFRTVGSEGNHLKMKVSDNSSLLDAIGFNLGIYEKVLGQEDQFDIVFALEKNEWRGKTNLQLNVKDFKPSFYADDPFADEHTLTQESGFIDRLFKNAVTYLTDDYYRDIAGKDEFFTKVAGVTFEDRQEVVGSLFEGECLTLVREPDNPFDSNAISVLKETGVQVGYLNARLAKHFAPLLDKNEQYSVYVSQVTGGSDKNFGVNIIIQKAYYGSSEESLQKATERREELSGLNDEELLETIRQALLGDKPYREKQLAALKQLLCNRNTLAIFGTGRGKSAVFQSVAAFKALRSQETTVIVYPLRALVNDQFENMVVRLEGLGLRVYKGNGSISTGERVLLFEAMEKGHLDILLTTPEFVHHHLRKIRNMKQRIGLFVVDESHHIGMSSVTHRPVYKRLGELVGGIGNPVVLAVTATANEETADEIIAALGITEIVIDTHIRSNLQLIDKRECQDKTGYLKQLVSTGEKTIIYVNSRLQTVELAAMLRESIMEKRDKIAFYHAGLGNEERNTVEKMFRTGQLTTVVSTSAFGEGIDIVDIKNIIVFHLNFNFTEFNQQCGRCGRDGNAANIHILCGKRDAVINQFILESSAPSRDTLAKLYIVLKEMAAKAQPIQASNDDIAKLLKQAGIRSARPNMVSMGIGILEELDLVQRETIGRNRKIFLLPSPEGKINLEKSLRFTECLEEVKEFQFFQEHFFKSDQVELLNRINRPIYPAKYLKQEGTEIQ